jgi:hypothetical protein
MLNIEVKRVKNTTQKQQRHKLQCNLSKTLQSYRGSLEQLQRLIIESPST